jgi:hypothetical protein
MGRTILIVILLIGLGAAGGFAFYQTNNLQALQNNSTEVVAALEASSSQAVGFGMASETAFADSAYSTVTEAAQSFSDAAATSTEAASIYQENAENAAATSSQSAENFAATSSQAAEEARATVTTLANAANTQSAEFDEFVDISASLALESGYAIGTLGADVATVSGLGTESANMIETQSANATAAAESASYEQATMQAQNLVLSGTLEASGWSGEGIFGESAALPDRFENYEGEGYEIALPESFEGADLHDSPRSFYARLDRLGFEATSDYLREQNEDFLFFAIDTDLVNDLPRATVSIVRDVPSIEATLADYLGGAYVALEGNAALVISDVLPMNGQAVGRSIVEQSFEGASVRQMQYVFQVENSFYVITFTVPVSEFAAMRPILQQSAGTFRLRD